MLRFLFIFIIALSSYAETKRIELLKRVREVQGLELTIQKESQAWKSEKEQLELLVKVYQNRKIDKDESIKLLKSEKQSLSKKLADLKLKREALKSQFTTLHTTLDSLSNDLLGQWHSRLPKSMQNLMPDEHSALKSAKSLTEKISSIESYTIAYLELQKQKHFLSESHKFSDGEWQLNCLYLGTVQGYFMSVDGSKCGKIVYSNKQWEFMEDQSLRQALTEAFAQMKQKDRPKLVELPLEVYK